MCGLRTRPRTDVDPPRVELPSAGVYRVAAPGGDTLFFFVLLRIPRRDDVPPADRGGSTSVRGRIRSPPLFTETNEQKFSLGGVKC